MTIAEFWAQARPAVRAEVLQLAGVPKEWISVLCWLDWSELKPLTVAMLERNWDVTDPLPVRMNA